MYSNNGFSRACPSGNTAFCNPPEREHCRNCDDDGIVDCPECAGTSITDCDRCGGKGKVDCPKCNS